MAVSFEIADVEPGDRRLLLGPLPMALRDLFEGGHGRIEAMSPVTHGGVGRAPAHPFVAAVLTAYDEHLPLTLSPDHVWTVLAQGFAAHVKLHAEALRERFVQHEGKLRLTVRRDDFVLGELSNPWPQVFSSWSEAMREHLGKRHDLIVADFSTTGPVERAVSELVLMDAMSKYFDFRLVSRCGIPRITLLGEAADWRSIRSRAQAFREFELDWWIDPLMPILDAFVDAAEGRVDREHWAAICKRENGSGGPYLSGWMQVLFPYLVNFEQRQVVNPDMSNWREALGPATHKLPPTLSVVDFIWKYDSTELPIELPMQLVAGLVGLGQERESLAVFPKFGWAVLHRK